jgi:hypothetical protein
MQHKRQHFQQFSVSELLFKGTRELVDCDGHTRSYNTCKQSSEYPQVPFIALTELSDGQQILLHHRYPI